MRRRAGLAFRIGSEVGRSGLAVRIFSEAGRSGLAFRIGSVVGPDKLAGKLAGTFQTRERQRRQESRRVDLERRTQGTVSDSSAAARSGSASPSASADGWAAWSTKPSRPRMLIWARAVSGSNAYPWPLLPNVPSLSRKGRAEPFNEAGARESGERSSPPRAHRDAPTMRGRRLSASTSCWAESPDSPSPAAKAFQDEPT